VHKSGGALRLADDRISWGGIRERAGPQTIGSVDVRLEAAALQSKMFLRSQ
jgi:hypothetical protein